jgi:hypothetical protein
MVFPMYTLYLHSIRLISPIPQAVHLPNHHTVRGNVVFSHSPDPRSDFLHLSEDIAERDPQVMDRLSMSSCSSAQRRFQRPLQYLGINA